MCIRDRYDIIVTSANSGLLGFVTDSHAIDYIKKKYPAERSLYQFYKTVFGDNFDRAQRNFIESLAGYSIICYLLQIKDRHNGNILIDAEGHLVHIDFGFIFCTSPGGINFESSPFKLTAEYGELMGGPDSLEFNYFRSLLCLGFLEVSKNIDSFLNLIQIMMDGSDLPCFLEFNYDDFCRRFKEPLLEKDIVKYVDRLITESYDNWRTVQYDNFQKMTNGIAPQQETFCSTIQFYSFSLLMCSAINDNNNYIPCIRALYTPTFTYILYCCVNDAHNVSNLCLSCVFVSLSLAVGDSYVLWCLLLRLSTHI
eukprot:TRINITY_DN1729_c0_g1_i4.p1 TRINITY_DN1729_c0_g1~~TRINITY_DN1729_c0_g1_i4.p1  ORF type:complete len:311 (-),score=49.88 TRINITY_DN1729_c0_g1_i4:93-1025(-)